MMKSVAILLIACASVASASSLLMSKTHEAPLLAATKGFETVQAPAQQVEYAAPAIQQTEFAATKAAPLVAETYVARSAPILAAAPAYAAPAYAAPAYAYSAYAPAMARAFVAPSPIYHSSFLAKSYAAPILSSYAAPYAAPYAYARAAPALVESVKAAPILSSYAAPAVERVVQAPMVAAAPAIKAY